VLSSLGISATLARKPATKLISKGSSRILGLCSLIVSPHPYWLHILRTLQIEDDTVLHPPASARSVHLINTNIDVPLICTKVDEVSHPSVASSLKGLSTPELDPAQPANSLDATLSVSDANITRACNLTLLIPSVEGQLAELKLIQSTITGGNVTVSAPALFVDNESLISASARAVYPTSALGMDAHAGAGGGNAGFGGCGCTSTGRTQCDGLTTKPGAPNPSAMTIMYPGGKGGLMSNDTDAAPANGGGMLQLRLSDSFTLLGTLSADGEDATAPTVPTDDTLSLPSMTLQQTDALMRGGGAAGFIFINVNDGLGHFQGNGTISLKGGNSAAGGGAGSGGILIFQADSLDQASVRMSGGTSMPSSHLLASDDVTASYICEDGAAGLAYIATHTHTQPQLLCSAGIAHRGDGSLLATTAVPAATPFPGPWVLAHGIPDLALQACTLSMNLTNLTPPQEPSEAPFYAGSLNLESLSLSTSTLKSQSDSLLLTVAKDVEISSSSSISAKSIDIVANSIHIDRTSSLSFSTEVGLTATTTILIENSVTDVTQSTTSLLSAKAAQISFNQIDARAGRVVIHADDSLAIAGGLLYASFQPTNCSSPLVVPSACAEYLPPGTTQGMSLPNLSRMGDAAAVESDFPLTIMANQMILQTAQLKSYAVALCGLNITVNSDSAVLTSGLGCGPAQGDGAPVVSHVTESSDGSAVVSAGPGAGHAGSGGAGYVGGGRPPLPGGSPYGLPPPSQAFSLRDIADLIDPSANPYLRAGSGGGTSQSALKPDGGSGGGVIYVRAADTLALGGQLQADGQTATSSGGGGSGGTVTLETSRLTTPGRTDIQVSVGGGDGSYGGGGGSAGLLQLNWLDPDGPAASSKAVLVYRLCGGIGGAINITTSSDPSGGISRTAGGSGSSGYLQTIPPCPPGTEGAFCASCGVGRFAPTAGYSMCDICDAGTFTNQTGSTECASCGVGRYSTRGASICDTCESGKYSNQERQSECSQCEAGRFSHQGQSACSECPANSWSGEGASACTPCDPGTWSPDGSTTCQPCDEEPPSHSKYSGSGCSYECDSGYVYPGCELPFSHFLHWFGGQESVVLSALSSGAILLLLLPSLICLRYAVRRRTLRMEKDNRVAQQFAFTEHARRLSVGSNSFSEHASGLHGGDDDPLYLDDDDPEDEYAFPSSVEENSDNIPYLPQDGGSFHIKRTDSENSGLAAASPLQNARVPLAAPVSCWKVLVSDMFTTVKEARLAIPSSLRLRPKELPRRITRIYISGNNTPQHPWRLHSTPPNNAIPHVLLPEYEAFAAKLTKALRWETWESRFANFLFFISPPSRSAWLETRRYHRAKLLGAHLLAMDQSYLRDPAARALSGCIRLGCSSCYTLAWIDILKPQTNPSTTTHAIVPKTSIPGQSRTQHHHYQQQPQHWSPTLTALGPSPSTMPPVALGGNTTEEPAHEFQFPMYLVCAGTGTTHTPFYIDLATDAYARSATAVFGEKWFHFIADFNGLVRAIPEGGIFRPEFILPVQTLLEKINESGGASIGSGLAMPLGGVRLDLAVIPGSVAVVTDPDDDDEDDGVSAFDSVSNLDSSLPVRTQQPSTTRLLHPRRRGSIDSADPLSSPNGLISPSRKRGKTRKSPERLAPAPEEATTRVGRRPFKLALVLYRRHHGMGRSIDEVPSISSTPSLKAQPTAVTSAARSTTPPITNNHHRSGSLSGSPRVANFHLRAEDHDEGRVDTRARGKSLIEQALGYDPYSSPTTDLPSSSRARASPSIGTRWTPQDSPRLLASHAGHPSLLDVSGQSPGRYTPPSHQSLLLQQQQQQVGFTQLQMQYQAKKSLLHQDFVGGQVPADPLHTLSTSWEPQPIIDRVSQQSHTDSKISESDDELLIEHDARLLSTVMQDAMASNSSSSFVDDDNSPLWNVAKSELTSITFTERLSAALCLQTAHRSTKTLFLLSISVLLLTIGYLAIFFAYSVYFGLLMPWHYLITMTFFPLGPIFVIVSALTAVSTSSPHAARTLVYTSAGSLLNALLGLVVGLYGEHYLHAIQIEGTILPAVWLLVTLLLLCLSASLYAAVTLEAEELVNRRARMIEKHRLDAEHAFEITHIGESGNSP